MSEFRSSRKSHGQGDGTVNLLERRRNLTVWVALFFLLAWVLFTHAHAGSFNDRSRLAAIESLTGRGTWIIDDSPLGRTVDRIYLDGHFYSDKPPTLTFIASKVYAVLHKGSGLSLDAGWCDFDESPCHCRALCDDGPNQRRDWAYYLLTLVMIGLPSALMLALFYHLVGFFGLKNPAALVLTATLGFATQVFPYSTVLNSHLPAAACLLVGFYALLKASPLGTQNHHRNPVVLGGHRENRHSQCWLFAAGLMTALAATFDLGIGLFFISFLGYCVWMHRRHAWPYVLGGLLPIIFMVVLDYQIVGNPLPPYMARRGYDYPGSRFPQTIAGNRSPENVLIYGLRLLVGDHGFFALSPVLIWAVVAVVWVWRDRASGLRIPAAVVGSTSGLFALYFILFTDNFGGAAYGPRWYTVFTPLLFVFVAAKWSEMGARSRGLLFLALAAVSLVNSYQGALNPWRAATPLLWMENAWPEQREPVDVALSGVTFEEIAPELLAAFGTRRVDKRWFDARSCLVIPPDPVWLFVGPSTPLDPVLAERSGLPAGSSLTCSVDLRPAWDAYRKRLATSAWTSPVLVPSDTDVLARVPLPASFDDQLSFLGYEWLTDEPRAGIDVVLVTAWRVDQKPEAPLAIFVHLLDPQGRIAGQFDGLGANPDGLYPGDVLLHVHRYVIAPDAQAGSYWLQVGIYNPETLTRVPLIDHESDRLLLMKVDVSR